MQEETRIKKEEQKWLILKKLEGTLNDRFNNSKLHKFNKLKL